MILLMVYCATTALDGYPSHLDKIHYIWMVSSFYISSTTFYEPQQSSLTSSSLALPIIFYLQPIFASVQAKPPMSYIISLLTQDHSAFMGIKGVKHDPAVPIILGTSVTICSQS